VPVAGKIITATGQIPVQRMTTSASQAFESAVRAVQEGKVVIVYPEGTLTRDPDLWPMVGKTGAARIALSAGVPVVPIANWGTHRILYPYAKKPDLVPRKLIQVKVGDPVDLDDLRGQPVTPEVLHQATDRIMADITGLLEDIRGETAPAERFDPKRAGVSAIGNPHAGRKKRRRRGR
jgi:1-acyl-sn-glycerol-3-phosphate acyltransferase